jgi:hypothetical protein
MTRNFFHLSILQMLVAMAVVAGLVAANRIPTRKESPAVDLLVVGPGEMKFNQLEYRLGWPFAYYNALTFKPVGQEFASIKMTYPNGNDAFHPLGFAANLAVAVITLIGCLVSVGVLTRRLWP